MYTGTEIHWCETNPDIVCHEWCKDEKQKKDLLYQLIDIIEEMLTKL